MDQAHLRVLKSRSKRSYMCREACQVWCKNLTKVLKEKEYQLELYDHSLSIEMLSAAIRKDV